MIEIYKVMILLKLCDLTIQKIAAKYGANVKLVEVPPGPPVLSTLVAEVYGPDYEEQIKVADQVKTILENTKMLLILIGWLKIIKLNTNLEVDKEKAMLKWYCTTTNSWKLTLFIKRVSGFKFI